ncbi:hypothetical protein ACFFGH_22550 [Lysobacter korlensis]|uniref:Zinc finger CGNR domain-containing protein n=1 Tax=Lysobacter korlensis TaxID=553636 RepID=A0ABV6RUH6_9GAMM
MPRHDARHLRELRPVFGLIDSLLAEDARWRVVADALPHEDRAAGALNDILQQGRASWQLRREGGAWRLSPYSDAGEPDEALQAAVMLARLVTVDGWRRIKRCRRCGTPFLDTTNGASRTACATHLAH